MNLFNDSSLGMCTVFGHDDAKSSCMTGEMPGDYGCDSCNFDLGLGFNTVASHSAVQLMHARWALLGTLCCLSPELLLRNADVPAGECAAGIFKTAA